MVNNTVNGKKIGKAAGYNDKVRIGYVSTYPAERGIEVTNQKYNILSHISPEDIIRTDKEYVVMKAYPGGNPNKAKTTKEQDEGRA